MGKPRDIGIPIGELLICHVQKQHAERDHQQLLEVTGISRGEPVACTGKVTLPPRQHPRCTALVTIPAEAAEPKEQCACGHPISEHCNDDTCCAWNPARGRVGGACRLCGCAAARPQEAHASAS